MSTLEELRQEADELGVSYHKTMGANRLQEKIEEFYEAQEGSGKALRDTVEALEKKKSKKESTLRDDLKADNFTKTRIAREAAARKTEIVRIVDNDQRVNNHTTTCTVNCSNEHFDLGTVALPLNERIEVQKGHIKVLRDVRIPLHVRDPKTGLSSVRMRPRYTISYEGES